ncbi:hypothetical protein BDP81DRAFT_407825 [Colletotrichum phormii]|uniref:Uncharacterized protein n=1 Tax=Colletotrichum phormii TaxID=359342 RepID=A0AAI9ZMZ0_9PEZI|nr:uncharacterized protein BDP81DRAFT_407825 [Colletotrichum phormii]KAK1634635.1 hypothetical protein BDP81DRAFT_407825 [Colletotrichum phormii]
MSSPDPQGFDPSATILSPDPQGSEPPTAASDQQTTDITGGPNVEASLQRKPSRLTRFSSMRSIFKPGYPSPTTGTRQQNPDTAEGSNATASLQRKSSIASGIKTVGRAAGRTWGHVKDQTKNLTNRPSLTLRSKKEGDRQRQAPEQTSDNRTLAEVPYNEPTTATASPSIDKENDPAERVPSTSAQTSQGRGRSKSGGSGQTMDKTQNRLSAGYLGKRRSATDLEKHVSADQIEKCRSVGNLGERLSEYPENAPSGPGLQGPLPFAPASSICLRRWSWE